MRRTIGVIAFSVTAVACLVSTGTASAQLATRIIHAPVVSFAPGSRILVRAVVVDDAPPAAFRCYFREAGLQDFYFVEMWGAGANKYVAVLPAPQPATSAIEYVLLAVNWRHQVIRTQRFTMTRGGATQASELQRRLTGWKLDVQSDVSRVPWRLPGFDDWIARRDVRPDERFGRVVRGLTADAQAARGGPAGYEGSEIEAEAPPAPPMVSGPGDTGDGWAGGAYRVGNGVAPPRLVHSEKPNYTVAAMRTKTQGTAVLECVVLADGTVGATRIVKSIDPNFGLDDEAIEAARRFLFRPATLNSRAVPVIVTIEVSFTLR